MPRKISLDVLANLFWSFLRVGALTIGGGYAMLPIIQREAVDKRHWVDDEQFCDIIGLAQTAPGAIAINTSVFLGFRTAGIPGAIAATLGMVVPSLVIILAIAVFFIRFRNVPAVSAVFSGVRPAVLGLIAAAVLKIGRQVLNKPATLVVCVVLAVIGVFIQLHPVLLISLGAFAGILLFRKEGAL